MLGLIANKVAIVPIFDADTTASGLLVVPEVAKKRCKQGIVKYLGPEVEDVKPGDYVTFGGYDGQILEIEDEGLLLIIPEDRITAIIKPPTTEVYGLYFVDADGKYWPANYEQAVTLIRDAFFNEEWNNQFRGRKREDE